MAPKLSFWKLAGLVIILVLVIFLVEVYITFYIRSDIRVRVYRTQFYVIIELIMLIGSRYIFQHVFKKPLMQPFLTEQEYDDEDVRRYHSSSEHENKLYRRILLSSVKYRVWRVGVLLFCLLAHLAYIVSYALISSDPYWFAMLCWICFGYYLHLVASLLTLSTINIAAKFVLREQGFVFNTFFAHLGNLRYKALVAVAVTFLIGTFSHLTTLQTPQVKYVTVPLSNLPASFNKFVIVQLSDIHLGPTVGARKLQSAVDVVNNVQPPADLIVITGDLVDSSVNNLRDAVRPLRELSPHVPKLFVTGNHEYYTGDVDNWLAHLNTLDIETLHNSNKKIFAGSDHICVAGTDDIQAGKVGYSGHGMELGQALRGCVEEGAERQSPVILLAHQPAAAKRALEQAGGTINLVLSGHTHGGQMYPIAPGAYMLNPFYAGLYHVAPDTYVYVSRGTFYFGTPMKMANTMEVSHITLTVAK